jgi:hypothetical protein
MNTDSFDLSLEQPLQPIVRLERKELELDARAPGVYDEDRFAHGFRP